MWKSGDVEIWKSHVPGELIARNGDRLERMFAAVDGDVTWIFHDGVTYQIEAASATRRRGHQTLGSVSSPMPATVVSVKVAPGDEVTGGPTAIRLPGDEDD